MNPATPGPAEAGIGARRPRFAFAVLLILGLCAFVLLPESFSRKLGLSDNGAWFLDTYAILASSDAVQAGQDPSLPNPLDVYGRPHSYSGWWFALGRVGLTRAHNPWVGGAVVGAFLLGALLWLKPRTAGQVAAGLLVLLSPVVLLAVNRANNDLAVVALLLAGLLVLHDGSPWRVGALGLAVVLATGLKFYPVIAAAALLVLAPARRRWTAALATGAVAALVLWSQWDWFRRAVIPVSDGVYLFGAGVWWRELGLKGWGLSALSALSLWLGAIALNRRGWCQGLAAAEGPVAERAGFVLGAILLGGCWLAGISYAYRWAFAVLLLPWLWRRAGAGDGSARATLGLLLAGLWLDGVFCLGTNVGLGPMSLDRLRAIQHDWQVFTQPLVWALMVLLAGWGWPLVRSRWSELAPALRWRLPAHPRWLLLGVLLGWVVYVQSDRLRLLVGLPNSETWFLDSYAVLAASDAHRDGLDAAAAGHYDPLGRPHRYSDWWYALGPLGLTRDHNFVFGLACVLAAAAALVGTTRAGGWPSIAWGWLVLLSPEVFLGFNRANNDLVVFALCGLALVALRRDAVWRSALALAAVALATGLKFYPVVAGGALALAFLRAGRPRWALASGLAAGLALALVFPQLARGQFPVDVTVHVWGARLWPQDLGLGAVASGLFVGAGLAALAGLAAAGAFRPPDRPADDPDAERAFVLGATILLACFVAGFNYGYRWIFAVWLGPWLWARGQDARLPARARFAATLAWGSVPVVLWLDGLLCLLVNTGALAAPGRSLAELQHHWRLLTQPVTWLLMAILGGALFALARAVLRPRRAVSAPARG